MAFFIYLSIRKLSVFKLLPVYYCPFFKKISIFILQFYLVTACLCNVKGIPDYVFSCALIVIISSDLKIRIFTNL